MGEKILDSPSPFVEYCQEIDDGNEAHDDIAIVLECSRIYMRKIRLSPSGGSNIPEVRC